MSATPASRYTPMAQLLHWMVFALFAAQYLLVAGIDIVDRGPFEDFLYNVHKSFGLTLLLLVFVRIWWRMNHPPPPLPQRYPAWQEKAATATHHLLYVAMVVMPLSGYVWVMAGGYGAVFFGIPVPNLIGEYEALGEFAEEVHEITGWIIAALVAMHVGAALYHQFVLKDGLLHRMLPTDKTSEITPEASDSNPPT